MRTHFVDYLGPNGCALLLLHGLWLLPAGELPDSAFAPLDEVVKAAADKGVRLMMIFSNGAPGGYGGYCQYVR
jgi:hypothetical protein